MRPGSPPQSTATFARLTNGLMVRNQHIGSDVTTMSIPPTQGNPANGSSAGWRPDAELLRSTLARLCERPVSGAIWPPTLLAFETGLPITEVELALDPGHQRHRASKPELAAWSVYEQLLYLLQPGDHDREVCQAAHERLAQQLWQRVPPPRDIAAIVTEADSMAAMAALTAKSGTSLRAIAAATRDLDRRHAWSKSARAVRRGEGAAAAGQEGTPTHPAVGVVWARRAARRRCRALPLGMGLVPTSSSVRPSAARASAGCFAAAGAEPAFRCGSTSTPHDPADYVRRGGRSHCSGPARRHRRGGALDLGSGR